MKIYFHLKGDDEMIPDEEGVEVSGPQEARIQAISVIEELRDEDTRAFSGWRLVATDADGRSLFTLDLDSFVGTAGV